MRIDKEVKNPMSLRAVKTNYNGMVYYRNLRFDYSVSKRQLTILDRENNLKKTMFNVQQGTVLLFDFHKSPYDENQFPILKDIFTGFKLLGTDPPIKISKPTNSMLGIEV